ncbi:general substrate transporter [Podospora australis]|uniref:General substrate transporter n=1 Tax=Podospora australis TaxID=1536484 RepID=A0AAN6WT55_9PEZI|nr:general substrate transporter [Podospora australis]
MAVIADKKDAVSVAGLEASAISQSLEQQYTIKQHWKCLAACTLMSMCPFQYGLDFGLIGGLQAMVGFLRVFGYKDPSLPGGWNLSTERQQLISSLMTLGAFVSAVAAGPTATVMGRKTTVWVASVLCIVSNVIMMAATNIPGLYAGRLLLGIANGMFMTFSQNVHRQHRGLMISSFQVWTSVGSLVGTVVDNFTAKIDGRSAYLIPLGLIYIIPVLMSIGLLFVPESPRWLMQHGKMESKMQKSVGVWDMFRNPVDRRRTVLAICALTVQGASGAMYMIAYGTYFFQMADIGQPFENSCILISVGVVAILINSAVVTHFGRRRVFLVSGLILCGISQLLVAIVYTVSPGTESTGQAIVGLSVGMVATYAWISGGELPSQRLPSYTFGLATAIGVFAACLTTFTAPYFINPESLNWGPKYGYIWTPSCIISALWVFFFLPEVKDRTLEEIDEMFEARLPARKFRKYVCAGRGERAVDEASGSDAKAGEVVHAEEVRP